MWDPAIVIVATGLVALMFLGVGVKIGMCLGAWTMVDEDFDDEDEEPAEETPSLDPDDWWKQGKRPPGSEE
jgi:hypothetical protein